MVKYSEITESVDVEHIKVALVKNFTISGEISIDDQGFVNIFGSCKLNSLCSVLPVKYKHVSGDFNCANTKLTSLAGCPITVGGSFTCSDNKLRSLDGCPVSVRGDFSCSGNRLTSLDGCPSDIGRHFYCSRNSLTSLSGCPPNIAGDFDCSHNLLTSLSFGPSKISRDFDCSGNRLTSFVGGPAEVSMDFYCSGNNLTSLDGLAKTIGAIIEITWNVNLPLLRLVGHQVIIKADRRSAVEGIINKYQGKPSRSNIIACQNELIAAGFEGNAKW